MCIHLPIAFLKVSGQGPSEREYPSGSVTGVRRWKAGSNSQCARVAFLPKFFRSISLEMFFPDSVSYFYSFSSSYPPPWARPAQSMCSWEHGYGKGDEYQMLVTGHFPRSMNTHRKLSFLNQIHPTSFPPYPLKPTPIQPPPLPQGTFSVARPTHPPWREKPQPRKLIQRFAAEKRNDIKNSTGFVSIIKCLFFIFLLEGYHFISECQSSIHL